MSHNSNGKQPLSEDIDDSYLEEEAHTLGIFVPPEPDEYLNIGEVDAKNWRDYEDIIFTDSLWVIGARSREGRHTGKYHGNFVPQIPYQAIKRFTKPGDVVLDAFLGSGTTLIESRRLGRHGIGIELIDSIAKDAKELIEAEQNPHDTWQVVVQGDSTNEETISNVRQVLSARERRQVQLLVMHPPYHDIIKFSDDPRDLCNAQTVTDYLETFKKIVYRTYDLLEQNHFLIVVIGDKYSNSEWVPLGFRTMEVVQSVGYTLKSIVVKNMEGNRAKRNLQNLWRQRAFRGNYYIFKHEYILFFQKTGKVIEHLKKIKEFIREIDDREELNLIEKSSFSSGEALGKLIAGYSWISPAKVLVLRKGRVIRAVVVDFTDIKITADVKDELNDFLHNKSDSVVDISVIAEPEKRAALLEIPGVSQVYSPDVYSLEQLAHALYVVRKAIGYDQRKGRLAGVTFASNINEALESFFESKLDYEWRQGGKGIGFKFFKRDLNEDFDTTQEGRPNFRVGIETKWVSGHENEKAPQISNRYYNKGYELIAIVGHNVDAWKSSIRNRGNFADYYLLLGKGDRKSLKEIMQTRSLLKARGDKEIEETNLSLVEYLKRKNLSSEVSYIREY